MPSTLGFATGDLRRASRGAAAALLAASGLSGCALAERIGLFAPSEKPIAHADVTANAIQTQASLESPLPPTRPYDGPIAVVSQPMAAELRSFAAADLRDGADWHKDIALSPTRAAIADSAGCAAVKAPDWFAPALEWSNCGDADLAPAGSARVRVPDPLYPIERGAVGVYEVSATLADGATAERIVTCRVEDVTSVFRADSAVTPAYVVACEDGARTATTWYAPEDGPLAFIRTDAAGAVAEAWVRAD